MAAVGVLRRLRGSATLQALARLGLVSRGVFFLLLAALAARLAAGTGSGASQSNANGALREVAMTGGGVVLLVVAAVGFASFAVIRLAASVTDERESRLRRLSTAGQALVYLAFAVVTLRFVLGARDSGSEQGQREAARSVLALPAGRLLLAGAGVGVLAACGWQLTVAVRGHFADTLRTEQLSRTAERAVSIVARTAIPARAVSLAPIGVFLVLAAVRSDAADAQGPDGLLRDLTGSGWGRALIVLVAAGFAVFAAYSFLEARYRAVSAGA